MAAPRFLATRIDIPQDARARVVGVLAPLLAQSLDLGLQAKQAHWNVKGPQFLPLHELFDKAYAQASEHADAIAERIVQLGAVAEGTVEAVRAGSTLAPYGLGITDGRAHVEAYATALAAHGAKTRRGIEECGQAGDADSSDLLTGISRDCDKLLWMLDAHLQG